MGAEPPKPESYIGLLRDEAARYDSTIHSLAERIEKTLLLALTVGGGLATLLLAQGRREVLFILPLAAVVALAVGIDATGEMFALAAHRMHLESELSELVNRYQPSSSGGRLLVPWDAAGGPTRRQAVSKLLIMVLYLGGFGIATAASLWAAWRTFEDLRWLVIAEAVLAIPLAGLIVVAMHGAFHAYERTEIRIADYGSEAKDLD